ncbi:hypothetical protein BABINDRAFT_9588 [Babjeviella inositovora NRRL Y-12698]|uniref:Target of rapamycin complex 2 subunit BIT2 n=1 Tax=Babjeviella inositovora NRRL Y-12698 TaxID=984486 RepID=A0A1E3QJV9_9ASCO|nr:uncharacterized protein BABINDRAFT_9588 [Babjeviella inositovora NRRL Y-12698]ODQ77975.1 hypothetical protein BABINDRAFT_9588 [Babjeviella inositovora NRRL Y-12698]
MSTPFIDQSVSRKPSTSSFVQSVAFKHTRSTSLSSNPDTPTRDTSFDSVFPFDRTLNSSFLEDDSLAHHSVSNVPFTNLSKTNTHTSPSKPLKPQSSFTKLFSRGNTTDFAAGKKKLKEKLSIQTGALGAAASVSSDRPSFGSVRGSRELERKLTKASTDSLLSSNSSASTVQDNSTHQSVTTRKHNAVNNFFRTRHLHQPHIKDYNNNSIIISSSNSNSNSKLLNDDLFSVRPGVKYNSFNPLASPSGATHGNLKDLNFNNIQKTLTILELLNPNSATFAANFKALEEKEQLADDIMMLLYAALTPLFENSLNSTANHLILSKYPIEDLNNLVTIHFYIRYNTERVTGINYASEITEVFGNGFRLLADNYHYRPDTKLGSTNGNITPMSSTFNLAYSPGSVPSDVLGSLDTELANLWEYFYSEVYHTLQGTLLPLQLEFEGAGAVLRPELKAQSYWKDLCKVHKTETLAVDRFILIMFRDNVVMPMYEKTAALQLMYPPTVPGNSASEEISQSLRLLQCFGLLSGIQSGDYNQKVVEKLFRAVKNRTKGF